MTDGQNPNASTGIGCGVLTALFGAVIVGGASLSLGESTSLFGDLVMMLLFGVMPLGGGIAWIAHAVARQKKADAERIENAVLTLAVRQGYILTAMLVAAETELSLDEAKRYLDQLADRGHVQVIPTDGGLAYRFPSPGIPPEPFYAERPRPPERERSG